MCAIACQKIWNEVAVENNLPDGISCIINGDYSVGEMMTKDDRVPLISATGSTRMGRVVGSVVAKRFGKSLLELGGNNAKTKDPTAPSIDFFGDNDSNNFVFPNLTPTIYPKVSTPHIRKRYNKNKILYSE